MEGPNFCQHELQNIFENAEVTVVIVPLPAQGHLNQLLHLSHLITSYKIPVHFACSAIHNRQTKLRCQGWNSESLAKIHFHDFELPPYNSPPPNPHAPYHFPVHHQPLFDTYLHLRRPVSQLLEQLATKFRRVIVIHDSLVASVAQDVKFISNAETYTFISISAFSLFFYIWERLETKPFDLDSDIPTRLPPTEGCYSPEIKEFIHHQGRLRQEFQSGMLFNTCRLIEGKYVEHLARFSFHGNDNQKLFAIGPFNPVELKSRRDEQRHDCLKWLDKQEKDSVIYVAFGSTTTMTNEQIRELAKGLEKSGQNFIWVLRNADPGDSFAEDDVTRPQLPEEFENRVEGRGMIVRNWAPQLEILAHPSIGGFMSHCGWNSCMESISMGVPIAAWPRHSEQPMNAVLVTEVLGIGTMVRNWTGKVELVMSDDIENAVRRLMSSKEGVEIRKKAAKLGEAVRGSVAKKGVSSLEMEAFVAHISR